MILFNNLFNRKQHSTQDGVHKNVTSSWIRRLFFRAFPSSLCADRVPSGCKKRHNKVKSDRKKNGEQVKTKQSGQLVSIFKGS